MITKIKILTADFLEKAVDLLTASVNKLSATRNTANSIYSVLKENEDQLKGTIYARGFFSVLETGRGPTKKNPSPEMIENLTDYARARGMENPKKAAWALAKSMNEKGDKTYQHGGRDVYSEDLTKMVDEFIDQAAEEYSDFVVDDLKAAFKK